MWNFKCKHPEPKHESDPGGQRFCGLHLAIVRRFVAVLNGEEIIFDLTQGAVHGNN